MKQIDGLVQACCGFYWKVVPNRLWYFIYVVVETIFLVKSIYEQNLF